MELEVKGITIHNTGNGLSALENSQQIGSAKYLCHYLVDENEVIVNYPLNEVTFHTGKGYDFGDLHTISIEVCRSTTNAHEKALKRAIGLVKELMEQYGLTTKDIYFHNDFNHEAYCPHRILQDYGKDGFIRLLEESDVK